MIQFNIGCLSGSGPAGRPRCGLTALLLGAVLLSASVPVDSQAAVSAGWIPDLAVGEKLSKEKNRPLIVHFTDNLSKSSRRLRVRMRQSELIQSLLKKYVAVELDVTKHEAEVEKLDASAVPLLVFIDPEGNELFRHRMSGDITRLQLAARLKTVMDEVESFNRNRKAVKQNPNDYQLRFDLGLQYENRRLEREAIQHYRAILEAAEKSKDVDPTLRERAKSGWGHALFALGVRKVRNTEWKEGASVLQDFVKLFPSGEESSNARFYLAMAYLELGREKEAQALTKDDEVLKRLRQMARKPSVWGARARQLLEGN